MMLCISRVIATTPLLLVGVLMPLSIHSSAHHHFVPEERAAVSTRITINGARPGPVFDGIGAISGNGNSRFLTDYPPAQRAQILNYLFGPGGADLQILKLEIGGDANSSDGSEPSIEHSRGQIDCRSGFEWWLAEQAVARDPGVKLYGLQWTAPGWVGSVWSRTDANYVIDWLKCAKSHGLKIGYLGGWDERTYDIGWFEYMRSRLNASGYRSVKIVAADARPHIEPWTAWEIAAAALTHPALRAAIGVLGAHNTCGYPATGFHCESSAAARRLGVPLWESELGELDANTGAPAMARAVNNGFIQARITGYIEWPLIDSMPSGLLYEKRGLVTADQPQSGYYRVNRITWAIAQTMQFVRPGWRYVNGADAELGNSGSYVAYKSPKGQAWSLVAENAGHFAGQRIRPQTFAVRLTGGLSSRTVHVWATNLMSADPRTWFVRRPDIHPDAGRFSFSIPPGYVVSFTSTSGQSHYLTRPPPGTAMRLPYRAFPDGSNEAWGLSSQEGAFIYRPCLGGIGGRCIEQLAGQQPVFWQRRIHRKPTPFAIVGDARWTNYTVSAHVLFTISAGTVSLIGRFGTQGSDKTLFSGYEFSLNADGRWQITRHSRVLKTAVIARGVVAALKPDTWHAISFSLLGSLITCSIGGRKVAKVASDTWTSGMAGIGSSWNLVQFSELTVTRVLHHTHR
jgi:O-glycosyl hydrolase